MKNACMILIAVLLALPFPAARAGDDDGWTLKKSGNGIVIYLRDMPGSRTKQFRAVMRVPGARLSSLMAVFDDAASYPRWMHHCIEARVVKKISASERMTYSATEAPWPVSTRDMVTHSLVRQDPKSLTVTLTIRAVPDMLPPVNGRVRIRKLDAVWTFRPEGNGDVTVVYQLHSEPGGSLPPGLANMAVTDLPFNTFIKLRNIIKEEKYAMARFPQITEPSR
ncbi:MAG TPA: START domain-containing protein [Spirochaetota bacterium]|nr:START domain-containing protein [Spirochaetota bacterium]HOD16294.1 START domain-containing protein [Spirochaetota bacterium]HPN10813.1 START domain-containing protein [Spirochaetota bacterium]HQL82436.1 START domain-containing protein [Spirochaetota bacterium]